MLKRIISRLQKSFLFGNYFDDEKTFISLNKEEWKNDTPPNQAKNKILVYVRDHHPRRIIEAMLLAKKLEHQQKKEIVVVLDGIRENAFNKSHIYKSFNVKNFYFTIGLSLIGHIIASYKAWVIFKKLKVGKDILKAEYKNINIGEEIYDTILRFNYDIYTISNIKISYFKYFYKMVYFINRYDEFFEKNNIDTIIFSDLDYVPRNALEKVGIKYTCIFYHCNIGRYKKYSEITTCKLENNIKISKKEWALGSKDNNLIQKADQYLEERFSGNSKLQYDTDAFLKKNIYTRKILYDKLGLQDNSRKLVCVAAHVFSDRAHYGFNTLYQDYYHWLIETIRILNKNSDIDTWVKLHPSSYTYKEDGILEKILQEENLENIHLLPNDFNTASIKDIFDYIVTCQGTMGLEMACFGIPVFTASEGYYSGFGIDVNSKTIDEYEYKLLNITSFDRLSKTSQINAKKVLYLTWAKAEIKKPSVIPEHLFVPKEEENWYENYWEHSYNQYKIMNERLMNGLKMKDDFYNNITEFII